MNDSVRFLLLLGVAGSAITLLGSAAAWWMDIERRLRRLSRKALAGQPDGLIIAPERQAAAAFRLQTAKVLVLWNGGANALLYSLPALIGAELLVDDQVVSRAFRGEARRPLEAVASGARRVTLRLVFDDPRDPDFDLDLWLPEDAGRRHAIDPAEAVQAGRRWIASVEAILRRPQPAPRPNPEPSPDSEPEPGPDADGPPWDDADDEPPPRLL